MEKKPVFFLQLRQWHGMRTYFLVLFIFHIVLAVSPLHSISQREFKCAVMRIVAHPFVKTLHEQLQNQKFQSKTCVIRLNALYHLNNSFNRCSHRARSLCQLPPKWLKLKRYICMFWCLHFYAFTSSYSYALAGWLVEWSAVIQICFFRTHLSLYFLQ